MSTTNNQSVILESDVPLSQSVIWQLQREFYLQRGLQAWSEDLVPNFITNNPFFAETYSRIVLGFLEDCMAMGLASAVPLRIVELGAGPGKFCYLFLRSLAVLLRSEGLGTDVIRYCMTDCSQTLLDSWGTNSYLAEFVESGMLQFEILEVGREPEAECVNRLGATPGPLVVIANYVFDSLPQDAFCIQDGQIFEFVVTTTSPIAEANEKPELSRLQLSYKNVPLRTNCYTEESWNQVLDLYRNQLAATTLLFPIHALKTLQVLSHLTDGRMLVRR